MAALRGRVKSRKKLPVSRISHVHPPRDGPPVVSTIFTKEVWIVVVVQNSQPANHTATVHTVNWQSGRLISRWISPFNTPIIDIIVLFPVPIDTRLWLERREIRDDRKADAHAANDSAWVSNKITYFFTRWLWITRELYFLLRLQVRRFPAALFYRITLSSHHTQITRCDNKIRDRIRHEISYRPWPYTSLHNQVIGCQTTRCYTKISRHE